MRITPLSPVEAIDAAQEWNRLMALHDHLRALADAPDDVLFATAEGVSAWSRAAHLYHLATSNFGIARLIPRLIQGAIASSESAVKPDGIAMLLSGTLPSGLAAPAGVVPPDALVREAVIERLEKAHDQVRAVEPVLPAAAASPARFDHPYLGPLRPSEWPRLMNAHTLHHLAIDARIHSRT
ncbi:MAG: DinB family protein [Rhodothermales bacterium]